jgi:hypothetical protein
VGADLEAGGFLDRGSPPGPPPVLHVIPVGDRGISPAPEVLVLDRVALPTKLSMGGTLPQAGGLSLYLEPAGFRLGPYVLGRRELYRHAAGGV